MRYNINSILFLTIVLAGSARGASSIVHYLDAGNSVDVKYSTRGDDLGIFCYKGKPKYIIHIWQSVLLQIEVPSDNFVHYEGWNPGEVKQEYDEHRSSWSLNLFSWKYNNFKLDPFNQSCIGIQSHEDYRVNLNVIRIDYWKVLSLVIGVVLFVSAAKLSRNKIFYYICGVSAGICASFLILIYLFSKLFPKKPLMYGVIAGGWAVGVYLLQLLWDNVRIIMTAYQTYVYWYIVVTGAISFFVCYRFGPVKNERTQNIIQWSLQFTALVLMFRSSHFQEAAVGQIVVLLIVYNFPKSWVSRSKTYWKRRFPPKVRLLSNDEYYAQGVRHTTKALADLRHYCSSPNCNQWRTALKIKDVKRFASFVEGGSHLSDSEILDYESTLHQTEFTDDESGPELDE